VSDKGLPGAFKVPTLRNVALTAPYMHNGSLASLEEVVQFYADGAGRPRGVERVDPLLKGFELSAAEKADLIAFLEALTDESALPAVPERAVSGLQGVGSRE
jgi:cytochrome c peroxidase